ncbi:uncharacterized protein LOC130629851 [Hydractinia symbiolongicarpus]|uniref:uncharacterized protein LOC130629851 n=1 Tax=Hydractinia symbiolongicarpus TaxID=13093 RepID=UPI00254BB1E4|nr:uncharacterized protein LOC130629851 [Hydractinia symbiolongicarpus]
MKEILISAFNCLASKITKQVRGKSSPWLSFNIKAEMNKRDKLMRKACKSKNKNIHEEYKRKRNKVSSMIRFWTAIKRVFSTKSKTNRVERLVDIGGLQLDDPTEISNGFCNYFSAAVSLLKSAAYLLMNFVWRSQKVLPMRTQQRFSFGYVSVVEEMKNLKQLKRKKAAGNDDLPLGILKDTAETTCQPLAFIINLSLNTGILPSDWKTAKVIPLQKSSSTGKFEDYRPISVIPTLLKIIQKIVHARLSEYVAKHNLLSKFQFGFRAKMSLN